MSMAGAQAPAPSGARPDRHFLGMPLALLGGYIAIVFCMTGDGIEQAFLSKYLVNLGFTAGQSALVFTVYGATAALSSWLSGVLADVFTPRRIMLIGVAWWLAFHCLFLWLGLGSAIRISRSRCCFMASAALPIRCSSMAFLSGSWRRAALRNWPPPSVGPGPCSPLATESLARTCPVSRSSRSATWARSGCR